jgi:hypothetical protein
MVETYLSKGQPNGPHHRRRVGLDTSAKRKYPNPEPIDFDGVIPAVLVHAVLGAAELEDSLAEKSAAASLNRFLHIRPYRK